MLFDQPNVNQVIKVQSTEYELLEILKVDAYSAYPIIYNPVKIYLTNTSTFN